jgi:hypothetical protein
MQLTFLIVFRALVVSFNLTFSPNTSEWSRFCWTFGNHVRFVLCFENGTLFPDCRIFPWNRPSWERLKGVLRAVSNACVPNMLDLGEGVSGTELLDLQS